MTTPVADFLPLCDVLFNIVGLAAYFCDVVFDGVTVYTLYARQQYLWFALALSAIVLSLLTSQVCSIGWYWRRCSSSDALCRPPAVLLVHVLAGGVLWRYCRLLLPIELSQVKQQVRDLSMLRMVHAMCQAVPMLLLQLYLLLVLPPARSAAQHRDVAVVSAALSLFSVCWALAAFGKNTRQRNVQRLVLTWPGVLAQLVWRGGTLAARLLALAVYAAAFGRWLLLALALHWLAMWLWQLGTGAVLSPPEPGLAPPSKPWPAVPCTGRLCRCAWAAAVAYVHTFCYVNVDEGRSLVRALVFYGVMLLENVLLMAVSAASRPVLLPLSGLMLALFTLGIGFMTLYYRCFHVRRLSYGGSVPAGASPASTDPPGVCTARDLPVNQHQLYANVRMSGAVQSDQLQNLPDVRAGLSAASSGGASRALPAPSIGVFNCRFNPPVIKRKKKKPTTFVPPPLLLAPFWRRPLPPAADPGRAPGPDGSAPDASSMVQQKLMQKRCQQQAELGLIQREIEQGKLAARPSQQQLHVPQPSPAAGLVTRCKRRRYDVTQPADQWYLSVRVPPCTTAAASDTAESRLSWPRSYTLPRSHAPPVAHTRAVSDLVGGGAAAAHSRVRFSESSDAPDEADSECDVGQAVMLRNSMLLQQHAAAVRARQFRLRPRDYSQHETKL